MADESWIFRWENIHGYFAGHLRKGKDLIRRARSKGQDLVLLLVTRSSSFYSKCFWLTCLLGFKRFPYDEHKINKWFVQEFASEDGQVKRVNIMNVDQEGIRNKLYGSQGRAKDFPNSLSNDDYDLFCHGTKHEFAKDIIEGGIDLSKVGKGEPSDFSDESGYYLCDSFDVAFDWAQRNFRRPSEGQAVLIYRVHKNQLRQLRGEGDESGLDLRNDKEMWLQVVKEYRKPYLPRSDPINKRLRKSLKRRPFIEGPITSERTRNPFATDFENNTYQLCVRNDICSQLFNNSLHSVVFVRV